MAILPPPDEEILQRGDISVLNNIIGFIIANRIDSTTLAYIMRLEAIIGSLERLHNVNSGFLLTDSSKEIIEDEIRFQTKLKNEE